MRFCYHKWQASFTHNKVAIDYGCCQFTCNTLWFSKEVPREAEEGEKKNQSKKEKKMSSSSDDLHGVRFFKIILDQTIADKRLRLPRRFARQYGGRLGGEASLLDRYGLEWKMDIVKDDGNNKRCWFENGWEEFAEFYSLSNGDCVVFECKGTSCDDQEDSLEFSIMVLDGETEMEMEISSQMMTAIAADTFMSNSNHPCFKHEVTPSYFTLKMMPIPQEFFNSYLARADDMMGLIKIGYGGKLWNVEITHHGHENRYRRFHPADWRRFLEDNSIKQGDVCVFELIDDHVMLLQVHIFRGSN